MVNLEFANRATVFSPATASTLQKPMFFDRAKRIALRSRANKRLKRWGRVLAAVILILGGFDLISTDAALTAGQIEGNPLVGSIQAELGSLWALPKIAFHLALACLVLWIPSKRMLFIGAVVSAGYVLLVANNLYLA